MTLQADVTSRIEPQALIELTNRRDSSATTPDTTYLALVCDDVQGVIEIEMGVGYQDPNLESRDLAFQKTMATQGVLILLEMYASAEGQKLAGRYERWTEALRARRRRQGVTADTNAKSDPTPDQATDVPVFDKGYMGKNFVPRMGGYGRPREDDG